MKIDEILQFDKLDKSKIGYSSSFEPGLISAWDDIKLDIRNGIAKEIKPFPFEIPLRIFDDGDIISIVGFLQNRPVLIFETQRYRDGFIVNNVRLEPEIRGRAIASKLYAMFVKVHHAPLYSGEYQTPASHNGIWKKLIQVYPNRVIGFDQKTKQELPLDITAKGPAVHGKEQIYNRIKNSKIDYKRSRNKAERTRLLKLLP